ncbi:hypothetical protein CEXT_649601 [Caerostris extrusa]|uniref:Uncharacterized protein n=1 Tax=Caerostris extrusa TaxID=172846 RepID=A0AAV4T7S7_CAEEX|nr:hypothetical protein CEXT_649601 [Caerostris extrusa]
MLEWKDGVLLAIVRKIPFDSISITRDDNDMMTIQELVQKFCFAHPDSKMLRKETAACIQNWVKKEKLNLKAKLQMHVNGAPTCRRNVIFGIRD